jgi:Ca2+:H+ antiporter
MPGNGNGLFSSSGERTPLLAGGSPAHSDEPRWKSLPKHVAAVTWATLASNYVNLLLVFVPIGIIAGEMHWNPTAVFVLNFVAIIPLAALLSFATEELSAKLGQTLGGLCNATFGNAVELIVSADAHYHGSVFNGYRSLLLHSGTTRSASCKPACLAAFSPISFL